MLLLMGMNPMPRRRLFGLGLAASVLAGLCPSRSIANARADDETGEGTLAGRVVGADGGPLAQANVTVTSAALAAGDATLTTDDGGRFLLTPAPTGLYDVAVDLQGYRPGLVGGLHVGNGETVQVEIMLEPRGPGESSY